MFCFEMRYACISFGFIYGDCHGSVPRQTGLCSGRPEGNGTLSARRPTGPKNPLSVADPAQRGTAADLQHPLLGEGAVGMDSE